MPDCREAVVSEEYADIIARYGGFREEVREAYGLSCIDFALNQFVILHFRRDLSPPPNLTDYSYSSIPKLFTLLDSSAMESSGILRNFNNPVLNLQGQGVLIGFIDTGIDYTHPAFLDRSGRSRIVGIWDQTIQEGDPPEGIVYGTEYSKEQIDEALQAEDPFKVVPSRDENGHGTFLAGVAAGSADEENDFIGAAPKADILMVKLKPAKQYLRDYNLIAEDAIAFQENDIMMGITYLVMVAARRRQPVVICLGVGTNQGDHAGGSPLSVILNNTSSQAGVGLSIAAGNETGRGHHYFGMIPSGEEYEDVEIKVAEGERGFVLELWARVPELYSISFITPRGEVVPRIPVGPRVSQEISFLLEATKIHLDYRTTELGGGSQLAFMRFEAPTPGVWTIRVYNALYISGEYHMWLPVHGFINPETVFLRPDPNTTLTTPSSTYGSLTVAAYNHVNNSIYLHSSRGYTRLNQIKPDLAAPGVDVFGPAASSRPGAGGYTRKTGTSVAAAIGAGAAADLLTWGIIRGNEPLMNPLQIRSYLITGAKRQQNLNYPNREWGYGTLDLYSTFENLSRR